MTYKICDTITFRQEEDGNIIVFNSAKGVGFLVNPTSRFILDLCTGENDTQTIASRLREWYGASSPVEIEQIVESHLSLLCKASLVMPKDVPLDEQREGNYHERTGLTAVCTQSLPSVRYPNEECNLACKHCWITAKLATTVRSRKVSSADYVRLVDQALPLGLGIIAISGGEAS